MSTGQTVDADAPLMDSGVDSTGAVDSRMHLERASGTELLDAFMFNHPTARLIGDVFRAAPPPHAQVGQVADQIWTPLLGLLQRFGFEDYFARFVKEG